MLILLLTLFAPRAPYTAPLEAQLPSRLAAGRLIVEFHPRDRLLAETMLRQAVARDSFPGLPRPRDTVTLVIAPDRERFRELIGPYAPEWGAAIAMPEARRIVMQGRRAGSDAGDPTEVLRHELAHLALHEALGDLAPRWFDEGYASYAAGEWSREEVLATNLALAVRGPPTFEGLEAAFDGGTMRAQQAYALAYRAVAELAALDPERGLAPLFVEWRRTGSLDRAVRGAYGITLAGFEERWQRRTRRRYGLLAFAAEFSIAALLMLVIVLPLYAARRRRDRERMAALVEADRTAAIEDREGALAALLETGDERGEAGEGERRPGAPPRGEADRAGAGDAPDEPYR